MDSKLKRGESIWLINKPEILVNNDEPIGFATVKPPTNADVFVVLKGYHNYLQSKTNRQSKLKDAAVKVYFDIINWWEKTGIQLMSKPRIIERIIKLNDTWQYLYWHRKDENDRKGKKQKFKEECSKTFWPVSAKVQKEMECSSDKRKIEDARFLQSMKTTREGGVGGLDRNKVMTEKRKFQRKNKVTPNENRPVLICDEHIETDESNSCDEEYIPCPSKKKKLRIDSKFTLTENNDADWKKQLCLIGDKYGNSTGCITETASAMLKSGGVDLADTRISLSSVWRQRNAIRESSAKSIIQNKTLLLNKKLWSLHWDGKLLKSLQHIIQNEERIAIILKSGKDEILLEILKLDGKGNAQNVSDSIIFVINSYHVDYKTSSFLFTTRLL